MEWINIKDAKPEFSQPYLISISSIEDNKKTYIYNYYAYYNIETGKFHEYNSEKALIGNEINKKVIGWLKGLTNYLG